MEIMEYAYIEPIPIYILNSNMYSTNTYTFININRRWIELYNMKLMDKENKRAEQKRKKEEEERKKEEEERKKEKKEKKHMKKEDKEIIVDNPNSKKDSNIVEKGAELIKDSLWLLSGIVKYQQ